MSIFDKVVDAIASPVKKVERVFDKVTGELGKATKKALNGVAKSGDPFSTSLTRG